MISFVLLILIIQKYMNLRKSSISNHVSYMICTVIRTVINKKERRLLRATSDDLLYSLNGLP